MSKISKGNNNNKMGNSNTKLPKEIALKAKKVFSIIDKDGSGEIEKEETMKFW